VNSFSIPSSSSQVVWAFGVMIGSVEMDLDLPMSADEVDNPVLLEDFSGFGFFPWVDSSRSSCCGNALSPH
jgi:hypothetical protein